MKKAVMFICLLLSVAGIVLLVLHMTSGADDKKLLAAGLLCTSSGSLVNLCMQRSARKDQEKQDNG